MEVDIDREEPMLMKAVQDARQTIQSLDVGMASVESLLREGTRLGDVDARFTLAGKLAMKLKEDAERLSSELQHLHLMLKVGHL